MIMGKGAETTSYKVRTIFGVDTQFIGNLHFKDSLQINGHFEGSIESPGLLVVEYGALVHADVNVGTLIVGGKIVGDVQTDESLKILNSGCIVGNIRSPNLIMEDGTEIQGRIEMINNYSEFDIFEVPIDRIMKTIERVR